METAKSKAGVDEESSRRGEARDLKASFGDAGMEGITKGWQQRHKFCTEVTRKDTGCSLATFLDLRLKGNKAYNSGRMNSNLKGKVYKLATLKPVQLWAGTRAAQGAWGCFPLQIHSSQGRKCISGVACPPQVHN